MWQGHFQISTTADVLHHGGLYQCTRQAVTNVYAEVAKTYRKPNATRFRRSAPPAPPACGWRVRRRRGRVGGEIWDWRIADAAMAAGLEPSSPRLARFGWGRRRRRCATSRRCGFVFWAHIHGEVGLAHREHASLARFGPITKVRWAWPIMNTRALRVGPGTCAAQPVAARLTWSPLAAGAERLSDNPNDIDGGGGGANRASARGGRTAPLAAWEVCLPPTLRRSRRREASPAPRAGRLVLYTKPGCCLCDGLKEKLQAAFLLAGTPYSLASLELQASRLDHVRGSCALSPLGGFILRSWGLCFDQERDITTNPDWEQMYQYEIPVLAKVLPDGSEVWCRPPNRARSWPSV